MSERQANLTRSYITLLVANEFGGLVQARTLEPRGRLFSYSKNHNKCLQVGFQDLFDMIRDGLSGPHFCANVDL